MQSLPTYVLDLDVPLPTWNQVLSMPLKQRMHAKRCLREYCRLSALRSCLTPEQIAMESALSGQSMDSLKQDYLRTMGRRSSENTGRCRILIEHIDKE